MKASLTAVLLVASLGVGSHAAAGPRNTRFESVRAPVRLVPTGDQPTTIEGLHSYFGGLRLAAAGDGIVVVNRLPLERYLLGLQEVPSWWPPAALQAQAVAARTYALHTLGRPPAGAAATYGFDICASVECQVFAGADVVSGSGGERWLRAVDDTAGRTILYKDEPILARYHSTSGGRTFDNEQIFTDERAYPYLKGVDSTTEVSSPLYRWTVYVRMDRLQRMMRAAGRWRGGKGRLVEARTKRRGNALDPDVFLRGRKGRAVMSAAEFRTLLGELGPRFYPDLYPSPWTTSSGYLPETLPSDHFEIDTNAGTAIVRGRGWGHGVGMSQWGAFGMAREGASYEDIIEHYYTGIEVGDRSTGEPIDVGVDWGRFEVAATGAFALIDGRGRVLEEEALGTWGFAWLGPNRLAIEPPEGVGRPLRVGILRVPPEARAGEAVPITIELSRPARVSTVTDGADDAGAVIEDSGRSRLTWDAPEQPGRYRIEVVAAVGSREERSSAITVSVTADEEPEPGVADDASPSSRDPGPPVLVLIAGALLIILVVALWAGRIRA